MRGLPRRLLVLLVFSWVIVGLGVVALVSASRSSQPEHRPSPSPGGLTSHVPTTAAEPCGKPDLAVTTPYPVTGFWVNAPRDLCGWFTKMQAIHRIGGDTLIRFGPGMHPREVDGSGRVLDADGVADPRFSGCTIGPKTCFQDTVDTLRALHAENAVGRVYVYRTEETFGPALLRCSAVDKQIRVGSTLFYRFVVPASDPDDGSCDFTTKGRSYRLFLIAGSARDSLAEMLDMAGRFQMKVFAALPMSPRHPRENYFADPQHDGALASLTRRILWDYKQRHGARRALLGFYQPFEVQMRHGPGPKIPTFEVYKHQHDVVRQEMPGRPILASPYLDGRRKVPHAGPPSEAAIAFRHIAESGVDIIAPQDSRGTGKLGLFWDHERGKKVDQRLQAADGIGESTYGDAYHAPTKDYWRAIINERAALASLGRNVTLWLNAEAFEPAGDGSRRCIRISDRGRTDKARLDQAMMFGGGYASKVISYMWDEFYTCPEGRQATLAGEIASDWDRPIVIGATRDDQGGLRLTGYNLSGGKATLSWYAGDWQSRSQVVDTSAVASPSPSGTATGLSGQRRSNEAETIWVPFDWKQDHAKDFWLHVSVTSATGKSVAQPYSIRY